MTITFAFLFETRPLRAASRWVVRMGFTGMKFASTNGIMKTLKFSMTTFYILSLMIPLVFSSGSFAGARLSGDHFKGVLSAMETVNPGGGGTEMLDPNGHICNEEAQLFDAKIVGGEDNRELSSYAFVGQIFDFNNSNLGIASGSVCGNRSMATVAHAFVENGKWKATNSAQKPNAEQFAQYKVWVEGCGRTYTVKDVSVGTMTFNDKGYSPQDYSVIEFTEDICAQAESPKYGQPRSGHVESVIASGYYAPNSVNNQDVLAQSRAGKSGQTASSENEGFYNSSQKSQFSDSGPILQSYTGEISGQLIHKYQADQSLGGSGGPVFAHIDGEEVVVGTQFIEPFGEHKDFNFAMGVAGPYLQFLREKCGEGFQEYDDSI